MIGRWPTSGINTGATLLSETRYNGRLVADWQANRFHRFTLGGDFKKTNLSFWSSSQLRQIFMSAYIAHPVQYGLFAADRLDLGDVVIRQLPGQAFYPAAEIDLMSKAGDVLLTLGAGDVWRSGEAILKLRGNT